MTYKTIRTISLFLLSVMIFSLAAAVYASDPVTCFTLSVRAADGTMTDIRAITASYDGNTYASMTDISAALSGSKKQFSIEYHYTDADGLYYEMHMGRKALSKAGGDRTGNIFLDLNRVRIFVDGAEKRYYAYRCQRELYMSLVDIQLLVGLNMVYDDDGVLLLKTDEEYTVDFKELDNWDYFDSFSGAIVADATTDKVLYGCNAYDQIPIASTTKLMSALLIYEAVERGDISFDDQVLISKRAAALSQSADGAISLKADTYIPIQELMNAMLIASSNECTLALAEHTAGSEEAFVARMNERATELGLKSAEFYNSNGLPVYSKSVYISKLQNRMSPYDMFRLCDYLLEHYTKITDITSMLYCTMPTLECTWANNNTLVFNMTGVTGLKTGLTNRAGYCLVACMPYKVNGETHMLISAVFGAEAAGERTQAAELLLRGAIKRLENEA